MESRCPDIPEPQKNPSPKARICHQTEISHSCSPPAPQKICLGSGQGKSSSWKGGSVSKLPNLPKNEDFGEWSQVLVLQREKQRAQAVPQKSMYSVVPQKRGDPNAQRLHSSAGRVFPAPLSYSKAPQVQEIQHESRVTSLDLSASFMQSQGRNFCFHGRENSTGHGPQENQFPLDKDGIQSNPIQSKMHPTPWESHGSHLSMAW